LEFRIPCPSNRDSARKITSVSLQISGGKVGHWIGFGDGRTSVACPFGGKSASFESWGSSLETPLPYVPECASKKSRLPALMIHRHAFFAPLGPIFCPSGPRAVIRAVAFFFGSVELPIPAFHTGPLARRKGGQCRSALSCSGAPPPPFAGTSSWNMTPPQVWHFSQTGNDSPGV